ncbi:hypothetical protein [Ruania zhangjianzhongii]|uniref:hypothetical protein n=1 Tax=Ruania zhangjianzhongii TaxID=2603206 RepID=UPI0011CBFCD0|nr:hypothetical protein [Ruania zhangjianzhongii]
MADAPLVLPTGWRPLSYWARTQDGITQLDLPATTFLRCVEDSSRGGLPYLAFEVFWIESSVVHLATATGWALELDSDDDPSEEPHLTAQTELRLDDLETLEVDGDAEPSAEFAGQVRLSGALALLIHNHLDGGPTGYANSDYEPLEA